MNTRYRIRLGNVELDELLEEEYQDKLWILDISYPPPEYAYTVETPGQRNGGILTKSYRQKASVTVTFGLYIYDTAARNKACDAIKSWAAAGGTIHTNDKPDLALYNCVCEQYPDIESAKNWTDPLTMTFSSFAFPFWQDADATQKTLSGTNTSGNIDTPGNAEYTNPTVSITPNVAITWFEVTTGSTTIRVTADIAKDSAVTIDYDSKRTLRIRNGSTSLLAKRSGTSADELRVPCGKTSKIAIKASGKITAVFSVRGAWI